MKRYFWGEPDAMTKWALVYVLSLPAYISIQMLVSWLAHHRTKREDLNGRRRRHEV